MLTGVACQHEPHWVHATVRHKISREAPAPGAPVVHMPLPDSGVAKSRPGWACARPILTFINAGTVLLYEGCEEELD